MSGGEAGWHEVTVKSEDFGQHTGSQELSHGMTACQGPAMRKHGLAGCVISEAGSGSCSRGRSLRLLVIPCGQGAQAHVLSTAKCSPGGMTASIMPDAIHARSARESSCFSSMLLAC